MPKMWKYSPFSRFKRMGRTIKNRCRLKRLHTDLQCLQMVATDTGTKPGHLDLPNGDDRPWPVDERGGDFQTTALEEDNRYFQKGQLSRFSAPFENSYYDERLKRFDMSDSERSDGDELLNMSVTSLPVDIPYCEDGKVVIMDVSLPNGIQNISAGEDRLCNNSDRERDESASVVGNVSLASSRFFRIDDEHFILTLPHESSVVLDGIINLKVIHGTVTIFGYIVTESSEYVSVFSKKNAGHYRLFAAGYDRPNFDSSTVSSKLSELLTSEEETVSAILSCIASKHVVLLCKMVDRQTCTYLRKLGCKVEVETLRKSNTNRHHQSMVRFRCTLVNDNCSVIAVPSRWLGICAEIITDFRNCERRPKVLVYGDTNVGKSTFCRFVVNCFLNVCRKVSWLDADPGQPEFTPSGLLSLVELDEPIFGPCFTHLKTPKRMYCAGTTVVSVSALHYAKCLRSLVKFWNEDAELSAQPLVINTMGWITNAGRTALCELAEIVQPTHIIKIGVHSYDEPFVNGSPDFAGISCDKKVKLKSAFKLYSIKSANTISKSSQPSTLRDRSSQPSTLRDQRMIAYFARALQRENGVLKLRQCDCYRVPWSSVAVHVCHVSVPFSDIFYVINCNIVALCLCNPDEMITTSNLSWPKYFEQTPVCECFGYGIVRAIDMDEKCFYVVATIPLETIVRVNALLVGLGVAPPALLLQSGNSCRCSPYMSTEQFRDFFGVSVI